MGSLAWQERRWSQKSPESCDREAALLPSGTGRGDAQQYDASLLKRDAQGSFVFTALSVSIAADMRNHASTDNQGTGETTFAGA